MRGRKDGRFLGLISIALLAGVIGKPRVLSSGDLVGETEVFAGKGTLLVLHSTPVNSPASKVALEVIKELEKPLIDFVR